MSELLGWVVADWKEEDGAILPVYSDTATGNVNVKFVFGRNVTKEDSDGNPLTQSEDTVTITDVVPIYYIYGGSGMNNFVADKEGADDTKNMVSYGYFFDAACTQRIPSSFLITSDITVYVGFADYSEVEGDYYAVLQTLKNNEIYNAELHLIFDNNGKMTMYYDGIIADYMYVYNGEKLLVKDAYFAYIAYTTTSGYSLLADYYADIDGNVLNIYDNLFFTSEKNNVIVARKQNAAMGTWYTSDGATYTFLSDLTGSRTNANVTETFTYSCNDNVVTITIGSTRIIASITSDGMSMKSISAGLELEKRDIFAGKWESSFNRIETITFDGKGNVTYKGTTYEYVLDGEKATFGSIVATFDENGLLVVKDGEVSTTYGRDGSFIGTWTDTFLNYTIVLDGIGKTATAPVEIPTASASTICGIRRNGNVDGQHVLSHVPLRHVQSCNRRGRITSALSCGILLHNGYAHRRLQHGVLRSVLRNVERRKRRDIHVQRIRSVQHRHNHVAR